MLQLTETYRSEFHGNEFKIGSSVTSYFVPIINCIRESNRYQRVTEGNFILYHKPLLKIDNRPRKFNIRDFLEMINESVGLYAFNLGLGEEKNIIYVGKGYIVNDKDEILMVLTTKPDKLNLPFQPRYSKSTIPKENAKNLTLLVSTELVTNPIYTNFYKKLEKEYILDAYKVNIPVVFTTSVKIENLTYSNEFEMKFNNIDELQNHLINNVGSIMFKSPEQFKTFNPGIGSKLEDRQRKFVPVKKDEVLWGEEIPKMEGLVAQMRRGGAIDPINPITSDYLNSFNIEEARRLVNESLLVPSNFLNSSTDSYNEYPGTPAEAFNISLGNQLLNNPLPAPTTRTRTVINLIDDTEEPQVEDLPF
ncbi:hypothetical protein BOX09_gp52 [Flavobacterium phage Fpv1]|uniref:Uncharacterized protein n=2 Tax=Fipvunavirus Fpv1 TaxID=2560475 RepID=A0A1B0WLR1_9CAUD|nr:hypothetical protein BOW81_gp52 [Flavobacterium phage Fpv20]YP_009322054.1 hypothetical protein BOX09_gp52 [Flavobacterium phage Fpv1]YP_009323643.1 hypothetical protein BOW82_gp52 [Flavobacterium phage Fpv2]ALN97296.1 hypothetical protein [Flavobacterium phage FpV21]QCW20290.1 hypothetical protein [Flavobacterium phage FPSV-F12]QCW20713.1 hypothetical protein [Flavobacterium phage FPSV-S29]ANB40294.1 hypothetical protein [Flavobacterium phage Fpv1]ANB40374.1 hypothetical protein [Flavoba